MILDMIVADKKKRLIEHKKRISENEMKKLAIDYQGEHHSFYEALKQPGISIIGEFKKSSPSLGEIKSRINLNKRIREYNYSVDAISCLTEEDHFNGNVDYLKEIRRKSNLPILRKDFMIDAYQFYEAKAIGADAILLIAAILEERQMKEFYDLATELGLDALVEVHNEEELQRAIRVGAKIIGINNRNLNDFSISLETTKCLSRGIPKDVVLVAESGIQKDEDVSFLLECGVDAFLIGRALMEAQSPCKVAEHWKFLANQSEMKKYQAEVKNCEAPKVKICGITRIEEAEYLKKAGADYAGFVLDKNSKRYISIETIKEIFKKLNEDIIKVAVAVDLKQEQLKDIEQAGFDRIQLHGKIDKAVLEEAKLPIWIALNQEKQSLLEGYDEIEAIVIDGPEYGCGRVFDWEASEEMVKRWRAKYPKIKLILAGGLTADNVRKGIKIFKPDIVDVSSSVEADDSNGIFRGKDEDKIKEFIRRVKIER